jgi:hypothetical protein
MSLLPPYLPHAADRASEKRLQIAGMREKAIRAGPLRILAVSCGFFGDLLRILRCLPRISGGLPRISGIGALENFP